MPSYGQQPPYTGPFALNPSFRWQRPFEDQEELEAIDVDTPPLPPAPQRFQSDVMPPRPVPEDADEMIRNRSVPVQGGFDPESSVPGEATYGGPRLNTEAALAGLRNAPVNPEIARIQNAFNIRSTGRPQDLAYSGGIHGDVEQSFAPQRAMLGDVEKSMMAQHPAVRALQEQEARRKAMGQSAYAEGLAEQAEIGAEQRREEAELDFEAKRRAAGQSGRKAQIKAYTDILTSQGDDEQAERARTWALENLLNLFGGQ